MARESKAEAEIIAGMLPAVTRSCDGLPEIRVDALTGWLVESNSEAKHPVRVEWLMNHLERAGEFTDLLAQTLRTSI